MLKNWRRRDENKGFTRFYAYGGYITHKAFSKKDLGCPRLNVKVFVRLFQKAAGWRGGALPRPSQWVKSVSYTHLDVYKRQAEQESPPADMLRYGMAAAGAFLSGDLPQTCGRLDFEQMLPEISIQRLPSP